MRWGWGVLGLDKKTCSRICRCIWFNGLCHCPETVEELCMVGGGGEVAFCPNYSFSCEFVTSNVNARIVCDSFAVMRDVYSDHLSKKISPRAVKNERKLIFYDAKNIFCLKWGL